MKDGSLTCASTDPILWKMCALSYRVVRTVLTWHAFGEKTREKCAFSSEWGDYHLRWWLYEAAYRRVFGAEVDFVRFAALLIALHARSPSRYPCIGEIQMALFLADDLDAVVDLAIDLAERDSREHPTDVRKYKRIVERMTFNAKRGRCDLYRLVIDETGERRFLFTEATFSLYK